MVIRSREVGAFRRRWDCDEYRDDRRDVIETLLDPSAPTELRGADLAGITLNSTMAPDFWSAWLHSARLEHVDFRFAYLASTLTEASITDCDFTRAVLERATMRHASVTDSLFVQTTMRHVSLDNAQFDRCAFTKARFDGSLLGTTTSGGRGVVFRACDFSGATFTGQEWRQTRFIDCEFRDAVVTKSDFGAARFSGCRFASGFWDPDVIERATFDGDSPRLP